MSLFFTQKFNPQSYFITGIGTDVGKTIFTGLLARHFTEQSVRVVTQKCVQTGVSSASEGDILIHDKLSGIPFDDALLSDRCPYSYSLAASPHLAAAQEGGSINISYIKASYDRLAATFDCVLVEGAGGPLVPLSDSSLTTDLIMALGLSVIVVVLNKLGAIHDTLATIEVLQSRGIPIAGVVLNNMLADQDPLILEDNKQVISSFSDVDVIAEMDVVIFPE